MTAQAYLSALVLGGSVAMIAATLFGLSRALVRAAWPAGQRARVMQAASVVLVGWFAVAAGLAWTGAYEGAPDSLPIIQFGILIPIAVGALLIWRSATASRIIDAVSQQWLIGVHVFRALGAIFLVLYAEGRMPGLFALPAGLGDVLVTGLAPVVAWAHARNPRSSTRPGRCVEHTGDHRFRRCDHHGLCDGPIAFAARRLRQPQHSHRPVPAGADPDLSCAAVDRAPYRLPDQAAPGRRDRRRRGIGMTPMRRGLAETAP